MTAPLPALLRVCCRPIGLCLLASLPMAGALAQTTMIGGHRSADTVVTPAPDAAAAPVTPVAPAPAPASVPTAAAPAVPVEPNVVVAPAPPAATASSTPAPATTAISPPPVAPAIAPPVAALPSAEPAAAASLPSAPPATTTPAAAPTATTTPPVAEPSVETPNTPSAFTATPTTLLGQPAPAFSLHTLKQETVNYPAAAEGQPTVLMFWPSWCPYSRALQPYVDSIWQDYRDHGAKVWTVNIEETDDPAKILEQRHLGFPVLLDGNAVADQYGVRLMPAVVVMDGQGKVVYVMHEKTASPITTAKQIRETLNGLLGDKAVALPTEYPAPYDLHLVSLATLSERATPVTLPQSEWEPWVDAYLATLKPGEEVVTFKPEGPIADGRQAITVARKIWSERYGAEQTLIESPYRAYRINNHWVVLASGQDGRTAKLGAGFVLVLEVDSGRIVRVAPRG